MTTALIWILTPILLIDCLILGLLVIVQLPKKEAGVGMAFGGGATDALFGAGSGTALTKLTKYTTGIFFALVLILCLLNVRAHHPSGSELEKALKKTTSTTQPAGDTSGTATMSSGSNAPALPGLSNLPATAPEAVPPAAPSAGTNAPSTPAK